MARLLLCWLWVSCIACQAAVTQDGSEVLWCSNQFVLHGGYCYRYFGVEVRKPFHHAQKLCSRYSSTLVSLHSLQEEMFVLALGLNHTSSSFPSPAGSLDTGFWIGLNDQDGPSHMHREGYFKWSEREEEFVCPSTSYCRWKPGQPDNKRHLDCVKVDHGGWSMATGGCAASRLPFVCKKRACPEGEEWRESRCVVLQNSSTGLLPWKEVALCLLVVASLLLFILTSLHLQPRGNSCQKSRTKELPFQDFPT